jgi:hypothetical protein
LVNPLHAIMGMRGKFSVLLWDGMQCWSIWDGYFNFHVVCCPWASWCIFCEVCVCSSLIKNGIIVVH